MSEKHTESTFDPKQIVTPYAFGVAPELLGKPLATPKRRFAAILIDLLIAGILSLAGGLVLAVVVSVVFFIIALRKKYESPARNFLKYVYAAGASAFIFVLALVIIEGSAPDQEPNVPDNVIVGSDADLGEIAALTKKAMSIDYSDSADANARWKELAGEIQAAAGIPPQEAPVVKPLPADAAQTLRAYAAALEASDSTLIDSLEPAAAEIAARHQLARLRQARKLDRAALKKLGEENKDLSDQAANPGIYRILGQLADDTGLALGWVGFYFIICLAWWEGQTPGKRLLKLKVVRLNGKPLQLWYSFERFGGYAAGFATGLLGFFQIYWDPNRQGIHDKIAGTVVLDLRARRRKQYAHLGEELRIKN